MAHKHKCPACGGVIVFSTKPEDPGTIKCPHCNELISYLADELEPTDSAKSDETEPAEPAKQKNGKQRRK